MVAEGRQGLHRGRMIGAFLDGVSIGRGRGLGLAWSGMGPSCELSEFSGRPPGPDETTEGFTLLDGAEMGADFLEVGRRRWPGRSGV